MINIQSIFLNKILTQICFGQFDLQLKFHDGLIIMIANSLILEESSREAMWSCEGKSLNIDQLFQFLNKDVIDAKFDESKGLKIKFNEGVFHVPQPSDDFEYLHILSEDHGIYIF